jgi:hypothetical protein
VRTGRIGGADFVDHFGTVNRPVSLPTEALGALEDRL